MKNINESFKKIDLLGYTGKEEIKLACSNRVDEEIILLSIFCIAGFTDFSGDRPEVKPNQLFGIVGGLNNCNITVWKISQDGIYRLDLDLGIRPEGNIIIQKNMPDGSARRTDVKIVH